jgi:hypothetical protein
MIFPFVTNFAWNRTIDSLPMPENLTVRNRVCTAFWFPDGFPNCVISYVIDPQGDRFVETYRRLLIEQGWNVETERSYESEFDGRKKRMTCMILTRNAVFIPRIEVTVSIGEIDATRELEQTVLVLTQEGMFDCQEH